MKTGTTPSRNSIKAYRPYYHPRRTAYKTLLKGSRESSTPLRGATVRTNCRIKAWTSSLALLKHVPACNHAILTATCATQKQTNTSSTGESGCRTANSEGTNVSVVVPDCACTGEPMKLGEGLNRSAQNKQFPKVPASYL